MSSFSFSSSLIPATFLLRKQGLLLQKDAEQHTFSLFVSPMGNGNVTDTIRHLLKHLGLANHPTVHQNPNQPPSQHPTITYQGYNHHGTQAGSPALTLCFVQPPAPPCAFGTDCTGNDGCPNSSLLSRVCTQGCWRGGGLAAGGRRFLITEV